MNVNADILGKIATVTGILAGFSLTTAVRLISDKVKAKNKDPQAELATVTVTTLLCATLILVSATIAGVILAGRAPYISDMDKTPQAVFAFLTVTTLILLTIGLAAFLAGTTMTAWMWHKKIGILVLCLGVITLTWAIAVFFCTP